MLKKKAEENQTIAKYCEKCNCYNVAISRYYYSIYQYILNYSIENNVKACNTQSKSCHKDTLDAFIDYLVNNKIMASKGRKKFIEIQQIGLLHKLRDTRNTADYGNQKNFDNERKFDISFKNDFDRVKMILEKYNVY